MTDGNKENKEVAEEVKKFTLDEFRNGAWRDAIENEDWATHESLASIKEFDHFAKNYVEAQKFISNQNKIPTPDPKWSIKEWKEWNNQYGTKFGYPESPDEYGELKPDNLPEGIGYNTDAEEFFKKQAHINGLTKAQANKLWKSLIKNTAEGTKQFQDSLINEHKKQWDEYQKSLGKAFEPKMKTVQKFINSTDEDGKLAKYFKQNGINSVQDMPTPLIDWVMKISDHFKEDSLTTGPAEKPETVNTPREAESKINKIYSDSKHPFHDEFHPEHEKAVEEMEKLFIEAHPENETKKKDKQEKFKII